jgi:hypothetical protein
MFFTILFQPEINLPVTGAKLLCLGCIDNPVATGYNAIT